LDSTASAWQCDSWKIRIPAGFRPAGISAGVERPPRRAIHRPGGRCRVSAAAWDFLTLLYDWLLPAFGMLGEFLFMQETNHGRAVPFP
jgi:hypothetical protein